MKRRKSSQKDEDYYFYRHSRVEWRNVCENRISLSFLMFWLWLFIVSRLDKWFEMKFIIPRVCTDDRIINQYVWCVAEKITRCNLRIMKTFHISCSTQIHEKVNLLLNGLKLLFFDKWQARVVLNHDSFNFTVWYHKLDFAAAASRVHVRINFCQLLLIVSN